MRDQNASFERKQEKKKSQYLKDFKEDRDCNQTMNTEEMDKLGRYERFEKSFPFYKMDVNGFMLLTKRAMRITCKDEPDKPLWQIKHITLEAL